MHCHVLCVLENPPHSATPAFPLSRTQRAGASGRSAREKSHGHWHPLDRCHPMPKRGLTRGRTALCSSNESTTGAAGLERIQAEQLRKLCRYQVGRATGLGRHHHH